MVTAVVRVKAELIGVRRGLAHTVMRVLGADQ